MSSSPAPSEPSKPISASSSAAWSREPTTANVFFALSLPYRPPRNPVGAFFWRRRVWMETTFALSMIEPWEKVLIMSICYAFLAFLIAALHRYLPKHITFLGDRAAYYLLGSETNTGWGAAWAWGIGRWNTSGGSAVVSSEL